MKLNKLAIMALAIGVTFTSCSNDDDATATVNSSRDYENGILISHEGNFNMGNASVSYISNDFATVENNVFSNVNNTPLGDTAQSIAFNGDFAYIILNVSNTIEVVNRYTFESIARINTSVINPRYMAVVNGKGYVSAWGDFSDTTDDAIMVVDLTTNTISSTISTNYLPEEIIAVGSKVFVATGIFGYGNDVDVINTITDQNEGSITVGNSPNSLQLDSNGDLWVLSSDNLIEINPNTNLVMQTIALNSSITSPSKLNFDNGNFYLYNGGSVYKMNETASTLPINEEFNGVSFYDMSVKNGILYGVDAGNFASPGTLKIYDLTTNTQIQSITVDIIPGEVYFN